MTLDYRRDGSGRRIVMGNRHNSMEHNAKRCGHNYLGSSRHRTDDGLCSAAAISAPRNYIGRPNDGINDDVPDHSR